MKRFLYNNGLSVVLAVLFIVCWAGQSIAGWYQYNEEQQQHGAAPVSYSEYLRSGEFIEVTAENWESEFLQMFFFVLLTAFLYQKGSAESRWPEKEKEEKAKRKPVPEHLKPGWVRAGGWRLKVYEHSLSLAFAFLFLISFIAHGIGGAELFNQEQAEHGGEQVSVLGYFFTSRFWFESFQNWQSEFLAVFAMVVLSIWLREKDSAESKEVDAPHSETGT